MTTIKLVLFIVGIGLFVLSLRKGKREPLPEAPEKVTKKITESDEEG